MEVHGVSQESYSLSTTELRDVLNQHGWRLELGRAREKRNTRLGVKKDQEVVWSKGKGPQGT